MVWIVVVATLLASNVWVTAKSDFKENAIKIVKRAEDLEVNHKELYRRQLFDFDEDFGGGDDEDEDDFEDFGGELGGGNEKKKKDDEKYEKYGDDLENPDDFDSNFDESVATPRPTSKPTGPKQPIGVTGNIFFDHKPPNRKKDSGETIVTDDVSVQLINVNGEIVDTVEVDEFGNFTFTDVYAGDYTVKVWFDDNKINRFFVVDPDNSLDGCTEITVPPVGSKKPIPFVEFGYQTPNPCTTNNGGCAPNATCTFEENIATCACNFAFVGDGKTCKPTTTVCKAGLQYTIANEQTCPSGMHCNDVNECEEGTHNCNEYAECTNTAGSFKCVCSYGTAGDGITCTGSAQCVNTVCDEAGSDRAFCTDKARENEGLVPIPNGLCMCNVGLRLVNGKCLEPVSLPCANNPCSSFKNTKCVNLPGNQFLCNHVKLPDECPNFQVGRTPLNHVWRTVRFPRTFPTVPVVIAGPSTSRESQVANVNIRAVSRDSFQIKLQEPPDCGDGYHVTEITNWFAVLPDQEIRVNRGNVYFTAGTQMLKTTPDTSVQPFQSPVGAGNILITLAQVQNSVEDEILSAYSWYSGRNIYLQLKPHSRTYRRRATVGWVAIHGAPVNSPVATIGLTRQGTFVAVDCAGTSYLVSFGETGRTLNYHREYNIPLVPWWTVFQRSPYVVGSWSSVAPGKSLPTGTLYTNYRIISYRSSSVNLRAESATCNGDRVDNRLNSRQTTWWSFFAILPGYTSWATRGPPPPRPSPPNKAPH